MRIRITILILLCFWLLPSPVALAQGNAPAMVALKIVGNIDFQRQGWTEHQPLMAGTILSPTDLIFPQPQRASLLVMCPDGNTHEFLSPELIPNAPIRCPDSGAPNVVGKPGQTRNNIRRGGRQDPTIPYLIAPRRTVVRNVQLTLRWNAVPNAQFYKITVRGGGGRAWVSDDLAPDAVVENSQGSVDVALKMKSEVAYTVEICVTYKDSRTHCTTDPDWSTDDNLAFYLVLTPALDKLNNALIATLGEDSAESLYARGILLSQPVYSPSADTQLGVYYEAIPLLEQIVKDYPDSPLADSPDLYIRLGDLYRDVGLPLSATRDFKLAMDKAQPGTEAAAESALGRAMTTPDSDQAIEFYNAALDAYEQFLSPAAFKQRLKDICSQLGDLSNSIDRCKNQSP